MLRLILVCFLFVFAMAMPGGLLSAEDSATLTLPDTRPTPVTRQEVWQAVMAELHEQGLSEAQLPRIEDLDLPVALPAAAGRKLRVSSACWDEGRERTQFRLECGEPGQCLPFLVYMHDVYVDGARGRPCRLKSDSHPPPEAALRPILKPAVRTGDRATALFVSERVRISASVTCLERGREGEIIRVRGDEGEVFRARISGPALVEALPQ